MWVKFRLKSHGSEKKWNYTEYPDDLYDFDDDDDLGSQIWDDYYRYNSQGFLEFEKVEKPPNDEILRMIAIQEGLISRANKQIVELKSLVEF